LNYSDLRKTSQYRPEAVLITEELRSYGIETILEQKFLRENTFHCYKHGIFEDSGNLECAPCPSCSLSCERAFYQVDIFLSAQNICLEIKGKAHDSNTQQQKDKIKEEYLRIKFGIQTISARAEWFLDTKHQLRYEAIKTYAEAVAILLLKKFHVLNACRTNCTTVLH
jgi:hypothetical protein